MKKLKLILAFMAGSHGAIAQTDSAILNAYFKVKNDLVIADSRQAQIHIAELQKALSTYRSDSKGMLSKAVQKIFIASNIDDQRNGFNDVSKILWTIVKNDTTIGKPVYYQYCPMKKAYWISSEPAIKNPYYGSSMLTCGKVVEQTK